MLSVLSLEMVYTDNDDNNNNSVAQLYKLHLVIWPNQPKNILRTHTKRECFKKDPLKISLQPCVLQVEKIPPRGHF